MCLLLLLLLLLQTEIETHGEQKLFFSCRRQTHQHFLSVCMVLIEAFIREIYSNLITCMKDNSEHQFAAKFSLFFKAICALHFLLLLLWLLPFFCVMVYFVLFHLSFIWVCIYILLLLFHPVDEIIIRDPACCKQFSSVQSLD